MEYVVIVNLQGKNFAARSITREGTVRDGGITWRVYEAQQHTGITLGQAISEHTTLYAAIEASKG